jgi:nucleoside-diphosphate-sugar epimerase
MTTAPRHVLVTGAAGRIGGAVVRHLRGEGIPVTAVSKEIGPEVEAERVVEGDATSEALIVELLQGTPELGPVDAVVHLAAIPHRDTAPPMQVYSTNVLTTFNVLTKAAEAGVANVVFASSINASGIPLNDHEVLPAYYPIDVHLPADLADWYSLSKASDELTGAMVARRWGTTIVALRLPWTHIAQDELVAFSERHTRDPSLGVREGWAHIDSRDAARAALLALTRGLEGFHVICVAARETLVPYPTEELLERYAPDVPRRRAFTGRETPMDLTEAERVLGFRPEFALELEPVPLSEAVRA